MAILHRNVLALLASATCFISSIAAAKDSIPSHCKESEVAFLNARIHGDEPDKIERILSLCGDRKTEPLHKMAYRFGGIGKIELDLKASTQIRAGVFQQSDRDSHSGLVSIRFYNFPYAYEVSEGMGMTTGVRLDIYKNKKPVVSYKSTEYESRLVEINFDTASSPIFRRVSPFQPW